MTWSPRNRCGDKKENGEGSGSEGESEDDEELDHKGLDELDMKGEVILYSCGVGDAMISWHATRESNRGI